MRSAQRSARATAFAFECARRAQRRHARSPYARYAARATMSTMSPRDDASSARAMLLLPQMTHVRVVRRYDA